MRTRERDRDGSTHVVLEPWDSMAKLPALIPPTKRAAVKKLRFAEKHSLYLRYERYTGLQVEIGEGCIYPQNVVVKTFVPGKKI